MPNDWFQFKQFKVHQEKCAMKVSTDACIQGAWAVKQLKPNTVKAFKHVLDIGTGTGLLSLMLAQSNANLYFDAIEINEDAFQQAVYNFDESVWKERLAAQHISLSEFANDTVTNEKYDFIICNPPFFQNHLESSVKARNDARHSQSLSKEALAKSVFQLLKMEGQFCVMFPTSEWNLWLDVAAQTGLHLSRYLSVKPKPELAANRIIGLFQKQKIENTISETLIIYIAEKQYSIDMQALLKDYYLWNN